MVFRLYLIRFLHNIHHTIAVSILNLYGLAAHWSMASHISLSQISSGFNLCPSILHLSTHVSILP